jgi:putative ABC transport system permease protein
VDFGDEMERLYLDQLEETGGGVRRMAFQLRVLGDSGRHATGEWTGRLGAALRDRGEGTGMDGWRQDLAFGLRSLRRRPGFTVAAVLTLALGMGATVSMFSVVNGVLLDPLPYPESEDLVVLWNRNTASGNRNRNMDHPDIRAIQEAVSGFQVAAYSGTRPTLTGFGDPQVVFGARLTDGLIGVMGFQPALGRDLTAADDVAGGPHVVVISYDFWVERLGKDPDVLGRTIELNGVSWEIVGVGPQGFDFPDGAEFWQPRQHDLSGCDHGCRVMVAVGRIGPDRSMEEVQSALGALSASIREEYPDEHRDDRLEIQPMLEHEVADVSAALWILLGAVGAVLLIACANVANLLLVRANARRTEVALRATLGASRGRIVRQLLTENLLIAVVAGVAGLVLANWGTHALVALAPPDLPRLDQARLSGPVVAFAGGLVLLVTAVFGVFPALVASGQADARNGGRRTAGARHAGRSRTLLLIGEVALSLTLLIGAGLLMRTLDRMGAVDLGYDTERIERFRVSLPGARYDSIAVGTFLERLEDELTALPQVAAAGWGFGVPLASGNIGASTILHDRDPVAPADQPAFAIRPVTTGFLDATGTRLLRGRFFDERDRYGNEPVAVVNQAAVDEFWADADPIGRRIEPQVSWGFNESPPLTIIGVVQDVVTGEPTDLPDPAIYMSNRQFGAGSGYVSLRLTPGVESAIPEVRRLLRTLDPSLAIWDVTSMEAVVAEAKAPTVFYTTLLTVFSIVALVLAAVGLYGVVAYAVTQRTREIGIRIALGAASDQVVGLVIREGVRPAVLGVITGLALSWLGARVLSSLLYGVSWADPITLGGVSLVLLVVTAAATAIPARRASRVPPASALQAE